MKNADYSNCTTTGTGTSYRNFSELEMIQAYLNDCKVLKANPKTVAVRKSGWSMHDYRLYNAWLPRFVLSQGVTGLTTLGLDAEFANEQVDRALRDLENVERLNAPRTV